MIRLSYAAVTFAKIGLFLAECLIGLFNIITFPIRKISFKAYWIILLIAAGFYTAFFFGELSAHLTVFFIAIALFTAAIIASKLLYIYLNDAVLPRLALKMNSPFGTHVFQAQLDAYL